MAKTQKELLKGYCDVCGKEYSNIYRHRKSAKHLKNLEGKNEDKNKPDNKQKNKKTDKKNIKKESESTKEVIVPETEPETEQEPEPKKTPEVKQENRTIAGIQIIEETKPDKTQNTIDKILELAFSEQFAPVTFSILNGIALKLNGASNTEQESGAFVETFSGAKIKVLNPNF